MTKQNISDYTKAEFLDLLKEIASAEGGEAHQDNLINKFEELSEHPSGSDLIFWPEQGADDSPEGVLNEVIKWRAENNLPLFKDN